MTRQPKTTPAPQPLQIFMPPASSVADSPNGPVAPTPSPLPHRAGSSPSAADASSGEDPGQERAAKAQFPLPTLRLEIRDLSHAGAAKFLSATHAPAILSRAVSDLQRLLYVSPSTPHTNCPPTRSVTLVLRDMPGVAYTTGIDLDPAHHKEIHLSLGYVDGVQPESRLAHEMAGVLVHELVHCYQWDALGSCPGGLTEGIADWVRLRCELGPPHWKRETGGKWDRGYQHTAYFLDYLEGRFGDGTVRRINETLRREKYYEKSFWTGLLGRPVEQLWDDYVKQAPDDVDKSTTIDEGTQT